jgi:hypothetical protein
VNSGPVCVVIQQYDEKLRDYTGTRATLRIVSSSLHPENNEFYRKGMSKYEAKSGEVVYLGLLTLDRRGRAEKKNGIGTMTVQPMHKDLNVVCALDEEYYPVFIGEFLR